MIYDKNFLTEVNFNQTILTALKTPHGENWLRNLPEFYLKKIHFDTTFLMILEQEYGKQWVDILPDQYIRKVTFTPIMIARLKQKYGADYLQKLTPKFSAVNELVIDGFRKEKDKDEIIKTIKAFSPDQITKLSIVNRSERTDLAEILDEVLYQKLTKIDLSGTMYKREKVEKVENFLT